MYRRSVDEMRRARGYRTGRARERADNAGNRCAQASRALHIASRALDAVHRVPRTARRPARAPTAFDGGANGEGRKARTTEKGMTNEENPK